MKDWNDDVGGTLADVATACIATEENRSFDEVDGRGYSILANFRNPAMPTLAQMTDSNVKIASVVPGYAQTPTFWRLCGFSEEEIVTVTNELRRAQGGFMLSNLLAGGGGNGSA